MDHFDQQKRVHTTLNLCTISSPDRLIMGRFPFFLPPLAKIDPSTNFVTKKSDYERQNSLMDCPMIVLFLYIS